MFNVTLDGQLCRIHLAQKATGLFLDLYVDDVLIIGGVLCQVANRIVRSAYLGFVGDLAFFDTQPNADPVDAAHPDHVHYSGLGGRYFLAYVT